MTSLSLWVRSMQILLVAYPIANLSSFLKNSVFTNKLVYKTEADPQTSSMNLWLPGAGDRIRGRDC